MRKVYQYLLSLVAITLLFWGCSKGQQASSERPIDTLQVTDAHGFAVYHYADRTEAVIFRPGTQEEDQRYVIPQTSKRLVTTSATHVGFLAELDALGTIVGATNTKLIYNQDLQVPDLGDDMHLDAERILAVKPEVVFLTDYGQRDNNQLKTLTDIGVQLVYVNDWREQSPLGRAEWIKFMAAFVGREKEAAELYDQIKSNYEQLAQSAAGAATHPTILSGSDFRGTWYLPTGATYMGRLFHDAGFNYALDADTALESRPYNFEAVLHQFSKADVWVGAPANTLAELRSLDDKHALFRAFQTGLVYHFQARQTKTGGNDFWESGVVRPDRILQDLVNIRKGEDDLYYSGRLR